MNSKPKLDNPTSAELCQHIGHLKSQARDLGDCLRFQIDEIAFRKLFAFIDGYTFLIQCLMQIGQAASEGGPSATKGEWLGAEKDVEETIRVLLSAFEKRDFVLIADLIEYDLTRTLETWNGVLSSSEPSNERTQSFMDR